jgi:uncharacterized protein with HEPN domain
VKDDSVYLRHILEAIERILSYTSGGAEAFRGDPKTQDAVIRNLQVIGEASKKISSDTRDAHPDVPWKNMTGMRDRVVHDYFGVSLDIVWDVVENYLPPLREKLGKLLRKG